MKHSTLAVLAGIIIGAALAVVSFQANLWPRTGRALSAPREVQAPAPVEVNVIFQGERFKAVRFVDPDVGAICYHYLAPGGRSLGFSCIRR